MANLNVNIPTTFEETVTAPHITGLETPTQPTDAANKQYVDDAVAGATPSGDYLPLAGGTMDGAINMGGNAITNVAVPSADTDAANKQYVDNAIASSGGGVTFLGEGGSNTAHFFAFDLGSAVMLVGRFLSAEFGPNVEFTVGINLGVQPYSFNAMIPMTYYSTSNQGAGTIFTLMGTGSNTYLRCTANTTNFNGNGCFTAIFVK